MLLVDDDEAELMKAHVALHERVRADDEMDAAGFDLGQLLLSPRRSRRARQQGDAEARRLKQARDVEEMLLGQDLGRRHERDLQPVLHGDERGQQRDDRLARADVPLQQPVHRLRALQIVDDLLQRLLLPACQTERQHAPGRFADAVVDANGRGLAFRRGRVTARQHARLKQKRFLEDQTALGRRRKAIQLLDRRVRRRKMRREERRMARRQLQADPQLLREMIGSFRRQPLQHVVHQAPLNLRRDAAGLLVDGHDPAGVNRLPFFVVEDFVLRVGELQAGARARIDDAVEHDVLTGHEDVAQKRLVQPDRAHRPALVGDERLENLEAGPAGGAQAAAENPAGDRRRASGPERCDGLEAAAVLVPDGKPIQQIFDGAQSGVLEVRRPPGSDALEELQRRREQFVCGHDLTARRSPDRVRPGFRGCAPAARTRRRG